MMYKAENFSKNMIRIMDEKKYKPKDILTWFPDLYSLQAIHNWMKGKNLPSMERIIILCEHFDCTIEDMLR